MHPRRIGRAGWLSAIATTLLGTQTLMAQSPAKVIQAKGRVAETASKDDVDDAIRKALTAVEAEGEAMPAPAEMKAPEPKVDKKPETPAAPRSKRQEKRAEKAEPTGPPPKLPSRPDRVVVPPTIDSAGVDALLEKHFDEAKVKPAGLTGDEEFLRRVTLDIAGTLPTSAQTKAFLRDKARDKRARIIDTLLDSNEYARNWARYWRDVIKFRATNENMNQVKYQALEDWLTGQIRRNAPWDEIATSLLTSSGPLDEAGAANFTAAHMGQAVELAGEASRIFLGVQIQCAQCHDHPNDPWKREQFHEFAAFFAGSKVKLTPESQEAVKEAKAGGKKPGKAPRAFEVSTQGVPRYTMPDLKDPQKQIPVEPKFFLASSSEPVPAKLPAPQRRALVASYITGQDNPWFARAYVNRIWGALMGEGFTNPVDDLGPTRTPEAAEVLDALATQWQRGGYDVRWLFVTILNTKAYQREFRATSSAAGRTPFAANTPSRLRADQILDALSEALESPMDARTPGSMMAQFGPLKGKSKAEIKAKIVEQVKAKGPGAFRGGPRGQFNTLFGVDPSTPADDILGTIPQALFLMNDAKVNKAIQAQPGTMLGQLLMAHPDNRSALEALYYRVLARRPTPAEVRACDHHLAEVRGARTVAFEDILWCLINSTEFVSRR